MSKHQEGHILVTTVLIIAIASIWFTLVLKIAGNTFEASHDEISIVQGDFLAQGAMHEAMAYIERAYKAGTLSDISSTIIDKTADETDGVGTMKAQWQTIGQDKISIIALGEADRSRCTLAGEFLLTKLPPKSDPTMPILYIEYQGAMHEALKQSQGYHHVLHDAHSGAMVIEQAENLSGDLYCLNDASSNHLTTIRKLNMNTGTLYIQGDGYIDGSLAVNRLLVSGDLHLTETANISCEELVVGGSIVGGNETHLAKMRPLVPEDTLPTVVTIKMMR